MKRYRYISGVLSAIVEARAVNVEIAKLPTDMRVVCHVIEVQQTFGFSNLQVGRRIKLQARKLHEICDPNEALKAIL